MRINFDTDKMTHIGTMADKLDIPIPELIKRALHIVDTLQLCDAQNIKAVFIEEGEQLAFEDLFEVFPSSGNDQQAAGATENEAPSSGTGF